MTVTVASESAEPDEPAPKARTVATRLAVVVALVALDLWSKAAVFAWLGAGGSGSAAMTRDTCPASHNRYEIFGEWFAFMLSLNPGMAWGFDKLPPWLLVGGRCAAVAFLVYLVVRTSPARRALSWALVLILAGAAGNVHDNLFLEPRRVGASFGEVRDFIDVYFSFARWHFPTFNVADACITVGAVLLLGASFTAPKRAQTR